MFVQCDKKCGGGEQLRRVMCLRNEERATDCVPDPVPVSVQSCNTGPCTSGNKAPFTRPTGLPGYDYRANVISMAKNI